MNSIHDQADDSRALQSISLRRKFFSDDFAPLTSQISIIGSSFMKRNPKQPKSANLAKGIFNNILVWQLKLNLQQECIYPHSGAMQSKTGVK